MQVAAAQAAPESVHAFIQQYFDAWKGIEEDKILAYYSDDVAMHLPTGTLEGKTAVRDNFENSAHIFVFSLKGLAVRTAVRWLRDFEAP